MSVTTHTGQMSPPGMWRPAGKVLCNSFPFSGKMGLHFQRSVFLCLFRSIVLNSSHVWLAHRILTAALEGRYVPPTQDTDGGPKDTLSFTGGVGGGGWGMGGHRWGSSHAHEAKAPPTLQTPQGLNRIPHYLPNNLCLWCLSQIVESSFLPRRLKTPVIFWTPFLF